MTSVKQKISVNDSFSTFEDFENTLNVYKKCELQEFWIRDARTLDNQRKRFPETVCKANEALKYYYIRLACVKGGRKFKTKNENSSRTCTTLRQECPATIFLKISACQQSLVVVEINEGHNHTTSMATFEYLSQQRLKLPESTAKCKKQNDTHKETLNTPMIIHNNDTGISFQIKKNYLKASLTSQKKFNIMDGYGKRMAQLCSEVSTRAFHARATFIQTVIKMWEEGKDSVLNENFSKIFESDTAKSQEFSVYENQELIITESTNVNRNSVNLHDVKMPLNVLKRGRPKGFGNTVIGLKKKKVLKRQKPVKPHVLKTGGPAKLPIIPMATTEEYECSEEYLEEEYLDDSMLV